MPHPRPASRPGSAQRMLLAVLALSMLALAPASRAATGAQTVERSTPRGALLGLEHADGVEAYKAIPYALPPTGVRRWQPPQPAPDWKGVRDARNFSPQCIQTPYPANSVFARPDRPQSEDCLYLNVWTTQDAGANAPVMVWIHGGGLTRGTGATPSYDGSALARKGVVLVTINYRLGPFGFLAHPALSAESPDGVSGNYGYLDQIAALQWVHDNITAFGGDPQRVTLFGESAGSRSVNALMITPASKGLFQRAIGESGGGFAPTQALKTSVYGLKPAEQWGTELGKALGAPTLAALRAVPAYRILEASVKIGMPSTTVVDGKVIPDQPAALYAAGRQHAVPVLVGFNEDEGTSLTAPAWRPHDAATYEKGVRARFGRDADALLKLYPTATPERSWLAAFRDQHFGWEMVSWANAMQHVDRPAWVYLFRHHPPGPYRDALRAYHAGEIRYVFDNIHMNPDATPADAELADLMSSYWVRFAENGDPNGEGLPDWQPWDPQRMNYMGFDTTPAQGTDLIRDADAFWDAVDPEAMVRRP